jgi:hypothetical protein
LDAGNDEPPLAPGRPASKKRQGEVAGSLAPATLSYTLGFGTNKRDAMFDLFDRVAKSFVFEG